MHKLASVSIVIILSTAGAARAQYAGAMAQVASGGGQWTTTITLVNTGSTSAQFTVNFFDDSGNPLPLPITFPPNLSTGTSTASFTSTLNGGAALVMQTAGLTDPLTAGWAQLLTNGSISGFAVFTDTISSVQQQEAVAPVDSRTSSAYILWFDNTNGFATGVALANTSPQPTTTNVVLRDGNGAVFSTRTISLPPNGHTSFDLASFFPETINLRGTLEFDVPSNGQQISVLGLRFNPELAFSSVPALTK